MTPRWHRSRSLWFGLAGLVLMAGAFLVYGRSTASVHWRHNGCVFSISKELNTVSFDRFDFRNLSHGGVSIANPGFRFGEYRSPTHTRDLSAVSPFTYQNDGFHRSIQIAQWFIITLYTIAWLGGMLWWLRRKHRTIHPITDGFSPEIATHRLS
ncbi:MAG: hypothetical protein EOP85_11400 [Verrucomicrobiaceae bacterium]|nr:MAG: hypothetical protein EOP85_11400 [Verrucomicrobiaceae bacterium]